MATVWWERQGGMPAPRQACRQRPWRAPSNREGGRSYAGAARATTGFAPTLRGQRKPEFESFPSLTPRRGRDRLRQASQRRQPSSVLCLGQLGAKVSLQAKGGRTNGTARMRRGLLRG